MQQYLGIIALALASILGAVCLNVFRGRVPFLLNIVGVFPAFVTGICVTVWAYGQAHLLPAWGVGHIDPIPFSVVLIWLGITAVWYGRILCIRALLRNLNRRNILSHLLTLDS